MYYSLFSVTGWLSEGLEKVAGAAKQTLNTLCYTVDTVIYKLIINLYNVFELLCTSRIVSIGEFKELSERIGYILGIMMLFRVIFSFIQMLVDPDIITDKDKGAVSIIKKCIMVIVMLGMSSFAFDFLHDVQKNIITNHVISRLLLPKTVDTDNFGAILSEQVLLNFYVLNEKAAGKELYDHCSNYINGLRNQILTEGNFELGYNCLNETVVLPINEEGSYEDQEVFIIDFNHILSIAVGAAFVWILFGYCISAGVRIIQLTILEIISPMPIIAYMAPGKDNMFEKWKKMYFSTYIDVFIRIAIINFAVYICAVILDNWENSLGTFWESVGSPIDPYTKGFIGIVMILALLTFAKKAPDLIKELLPASASKIGFGAGMKDIVGLQKGIGTVAGIGTGAAIGLLGGTIGGAMAGYQRNGILSGIGHGLTGALGGVTGGLFRGGHAGFGAKGLGSAMQAARKNQSQINKRNADLIANGGTWLGSRVATAQSAIGMRTAYDVDNAIYNEAKAYHDSFSAAKTEAGKEVDKYSRNYNFGLDTSNSYANSLRTALGRSDVTLSELKALAEDDTRDAIERAYWDSVYNDSKKVAVDQAMRDGGAIKAGSYSWDSSRRTMTAHGATVDSNTTISSNMQYVADSSVGRSTVGDILDKAKAANTSYESTVVNHSMDRTVQKNKANAGK